MLLSDNPFYLLGVSIYDSKTTIIDKVDDKCFEEPDKEEIYENAKNILINPQKRIAAELRWFPGIPQNEVLELLNDTNHGEICAASVGSRLIKLNTYIYALPNCIGQNIESYIYCIDNLYEEITKDNLLTILNSARNKSRFPLIQGTEFISAEWKGVKDDIREILQNRFRNIKKEQYVRLANQLSLHTFSKEGKYGAIIDDFFSGYRLDIAKYLITATAQIDSLLNKIVNNPIEKNIDALEIELRLVGSMTKPLSRMVAFTGVGNYGDAGNICAKVYRLANDLYGDKKLKKQPLRLLKMLEPCFGDATQSLNSLKEDIQFLEEQQGSAVYEEAIMAMEHIESAVKEKLFFEDGHASANWIFYQNEFGKSYEKIINEFLSRSGYSLKEKCKIYNRASIIYIEMSNAMTWADRFDIAYELMKKAEQYAVIGRDKEILDGIRDKLPKLDRERHGQSAERHRVNSASTNSSSNSDSNGCGGCIGIVVFAIIGGAIGHAPGFLFGAWLGAKLFDSD